ncbi:hypothetical protein ACPWT1_02955 [Ramlibacter sp. MMS24-I3-19]|uniref:hypothetical protein n=1 Tax=Ramlibacter sp. MMS24-I3-19 TaxID=3416606 RepID=UPI003D028CFF
MPKSATAIASRVEAILRARLRQVGEEIQYTSKFDTARGRRVMLKRAVNFRGLYSERFPGDGVIPGVKLRVHAKTPGHYLPSDPRAASIASDPKLGMGCEAFYVECEDDSAVERFIDWYETQ